MLKRLWIVLSIFWAVLVMVNAGTRPHGPQDIDFVMAGLPFIVVPVIVRAGRFVIRGQ